jgi:hypothetical protein
MAQTTADLFVSAFERAKIQIQKGKIPGWFKNTNCYTQSERRGDQYRLPHGQLLELALVVPHPVV